MAVTMIVTLLTETPDHETQTACVQTFPKSEYAINRVLLQSLQSKLWILNTLEIQTASCESTEKDWPIRPTDTADGY